MTRFRFTNKAIEDLTSIWNYTFETWSEKQADAYYNMLIDLCRNITENPLIGKKYFDVTDGLYGMIAGKHIIFYRSISDEWVEVVRILHGSMDLKNRFTE